MIRRIALVAGLALVVAMPAIAGRPTGGTWVSTDLGGNLYVGRFSESWVDGAGAVGNTMNLMSWEGSELGGQWKVSCGSIYSLPTLIFDTRDQNGNGEVAYSTYYVDGRIWLSMDGPWGDRTEDYTAPLIATHVLSTRTYVGWELLGIFEQTTAHGMLDVYRNFSVYLTISNQQPYSSTDEAPLPVDYPPFIDSNCSATLTAGAWGRLSEVHLTVSGNGLPAEATTWGAVKALYEN